MAVSGAVFASAGTGVLSGWASLPLMSVLPAFRALVGWAVSHVGSSFVAFSKDDDPVFHDLVVVSFVG